MSNPKPKKLQTTTRLREDLLAALDAAAVKRGISRAALMEQVLMKFIREDRKRNVQGILD
jgi:metal-responsive CopG/Arc/MetJ family transcriptional regulator